MFFVCLDLKFCKGHLLLTKQTALVFLCCCFVTCDVFFVFLNQLYFEKKNSCIVFSFL